VNARSAGRSAGSARPGGSARSGGSARDAQPPKLTFSAPGAVTDADATLLRSSDERDGERFADADLSEYDLSGVSFLQCELDAVTLTDTQLRGARFVDTLVTASFAPTLLAGRTTWRDVLVQNPRWGSAEMFDAELNSVHIRGGKIDYLNLRNSRLTNVLIEDCALGELDLGGIRATRVAIRNCRIGTLDVTRATCSNVDLRSSEFSAINGLEGLRGVTIDDGQLSLLAPVLAQHLGLIVE
jgi:uncharacterized protein YjbI with pentapeptide repeats